MFDELDLFAAWIGEDALNHFALTDDVSGFIRAIENAIAQRKLVDRYISELSNIVLTPDWRAYNFVHSDFWDMMHATPEERYQAALAVLRHEFPV